MVRPEILRGGNRLRPGGGGRPARRQHDAGARGLRDLMGEGLIGLDAHRGAAVRGLTPAELREICELRILPEPMLVTRMVEGVTREQLEQARGRRRSSGPP